MRVIVAMLLAIVAASALHGAPMTVMFTAGEVSITGLGPGNSSVALISVAHEARGFTTKFVSRCEFLRDDDGDGVISYAPPSGVAVRSIWIVVNFDSAEAAVAAPAGFHPSPMPEKMGDGGSPVTLVSDGLDIDREAVEVLLVSPQKGAWARTIREGRRGDGSTVFDRRIHLEVPALRPLRAEFAKPPSGLRPGDVVAILDPERLQYWLMKAPR